MRSDRIILMALPVVALLAAFWFMMLSPKREQATNLDDEVTRLEGEVSAQQQIAEFGEQARQDYDSDYRNVVILGKAVPQGDETASLFAQLSGISRQADVDFRSLELVKSATGTETTPPPATSPGESAPSANAAPGEQTETAVAVPATEEAAANLPIGATVGPAGLPVMPYSLQFQGDFFHVADFVAGLDRSVSTRHGEVSVDGRLITIDGFSMARDTDLGFPSLLATFAVTTYVTPSTEGLTAGATQAGPTPVSATASDPQTIAPASSTEPAP